MHSYLVCSCIVIRRKSGIPFVANSLVCYSDWMDLMRPSQTVPAAFIGFHYKKIVQLEHHETCKVVKAKLLKEILP